MLRNACKAEFDELVGKLMGFRIKTAEMVESGGNKTKTAKAMDDLLHPLGWNETRIVGDFYIRRLSGSKPKAKMGRGKGEGGQGGHDTGGAVALRLPHPALRLVRTGLCEKQHA
ncbi:BglII/BstYI family type II restriction endonuclease [Siccirubricoccus deserti]|uniref:BglII/BstYI family type II restriction endonuclease n=1 Tax=Siccirubricoccus deserti TaxID=2013562 RepID=UPI00227CCB32|nr:BglII/BstYI family type II restriction endonuclease [Siccirubricoccus deserti]